MVVEENAPGSFAWRACRGVLARWQGFSPARPGPRDGAARPPPPGRCSSGALRQAHPRGERVGVFWPDGRVLLLRGQDRAKKRLGLRRPAGVVQEKGQVHPREERVGVVWPDGRMFLLRGQDRAIERLSLRRPAGGVRGEGPGSSAW